MIPRYIYSIKTAVKGLTKGLRKQVFKLIANALYTEVFFVNTGDTQSCDECIICLITILTICFRCYMLTASCTM